jgi:hypothetical protein
MFKRAAKVNAENIKAAQLIGKDKVVHE